MNGAVNQQAKITMQMLTLPDGLKVLSLNPDETRFLYREVFEEHCYLRNGIEINDGDCIFDVGANIGITTLFFHREKSAIRIFAIEPSPAASECLKANVELHGVDARIFECGLSNVSGMAEFTYYPGNSVMSGFYADPQKDRETSRTYMTNKGISPKGADLFLGSMFRAEKLSVSLRTLSEIIDEEEVSRIDLLKVDVEKSEGEVLAGIRAEHWPLIRQIAIEVTDESNRLHEISSLIESQGFQVAIEQDPLLHGTSIYDLYAIRKERERNQPL